jgi:signal transduction histidine kinase
MADHALRDSVKRKLLYSIQVLGLAAIYVAAARAGLALNAVAGFATLVWAPSGIALAALLILGRQFWPGILIGAIVANYWTGAPLPVAVAIGVGNTLEAMVGSYALRQIVGFRNALNRVRDVLGLIILDGAQSTTLSATIGVGVLRLAGVVTAARVAEMWRTWWLGDLIGDLLVAPVLLIVATSSFRRYGRREFLEGVGIVAVLMGIGVLIFRGAPNAASPFGEAYFLFPPLIWAALRFGQPGGVAATFAISCIAVWETVIGHGPFIRGGLYESLLALQVFMGITASTFLVLGASVSERRSAINDLEASVAEQKRLHSAAAEANRVKSEFMGVMSHELRTPLNAIAGYVDLLAAELEGPLSDTQKDYVSRIQHNEVHLLSLIEDVLAFARIEAGTVVLEVQRVRVHDTLLALEPLIGADVRKRGLAFKGAAVDASLEVLADPDRMRQILLNLLGNAMKFTDPGGTISVGALRANLEGQDRETHGAHVRIWVQDTGIGIPPDQLSRVLEPFVQVDRGTTRRYPGVGLGLSIARDLARAMRGDVFLESAPGQGTLATLVLPSA